MKVILQEFFVQKHVRVCFSCFSCECSPDGHFSSLHGGCLKDRPP